MILVTGPTGSGKTVSLYTCLNLLNKPGVNISTAEDPAEINLAGINQVNVNKGRPDLLRPARLPAPGPGRDHGGRDPRPRNRRDRGQGGQTGHLVMSTSTPTTHPPRSTRLKNMGVAPFNIASSVILITAQRLARRLCPARSR